MTYDADAGRWQGASTYTLIAPNFIHPDKHDSAVVFKAEHGGVIRITVSCYVASEQSDGITLCVKNADGTVELEEGYDKVVVTADKPYDVILTLEVEAGEEIAFIIGRNIAHTYDTTYLSVYILY